jgi:hypothetical protein
MDPRESSQRPGRLPPPSTPPLKSGISRSEIPPTPPAPTRESSGAFDSHLHHAPPGFSPDHAVAEQLGALESWALANERDARNGTLRFWLLKGLAFVCAVASSVAAAYGQIRPLIILGAVAGLAIAVDAALSGPTTQVNRRALQDIRNLQNTVKLNWDKVRISRPDAKDPARSAEALAILDAIQAKRDEIARYLASPQSSPGK